MINYKIQNKRDKLELDLKTLQQPQFTLRKEVDNMKKLTIIYIKFLFGIKL